MCNREGEIIQVSKDHYYDLQFESKPRFISYWHQFNEIANLNPKKVMDIVIGNKFLFNVLIIKGINIVTLDIDFSLNPNVVGSVINIPFKDAIFDVTTCFQVLEHLPYEKFKLALIEIYRVSSCYAILSLPDVNMAITFSLKIPKLPEIKNNFYK